MHLYTFIAGIVVAIVAIVLFFRYRSKVQSAAARAATVPASVTNTIAKLSPEAAQAVKAVDAKVVDKAKSV